MEVGVFRGRKSHSSGYRIDFAVAGGRAGVRACARSLRLYVSEVRGLPSDPPADYDPQHFKEFDKLLFANMVDNIRKQT